MNKIEQQIDKFRKLDIWDIILDVLTKHKSEIVAMNLIQLDEGKNKDGDNITPNYLTDPFFKTEQAARNYANWKAKITPSSKRNYESPNFFITGELIYNVLTAYRDGDSFVIEPQSIAKNFDVKYNGLYGLTGQHLAILKDSILPEVLDNIRIKLNY